MRARSAAVLAIATVAAGFHWGAFVAGGSDSYCYLNQAELMARGAVRDYEPLAEDPSWPGNFWSFVPAGHMPFGQPVPALVPICPAGYPLIMAAARVTAGRSAMFAVTPLMGGLAVYLMFLLGRRLAGPAAGLLAAALSAASPTFLIQLFQPMNDVTAAALWAAALVAAVSAGARGTLLRRGRRGLLTAAALVVRPNLVPLAAMTGARRRAARQRSHDLTRRLALRRGIRGGRRRRAARGAGGAERDVRLAVQVGLRRSRQDVLVGARPAQSRSAICGGRSRATRS